MVARGQLVLQLVLQLIVVVGELSPPKLSTKLLSAWLRDWLTSFACIESKQFALLQFPVKFESWNIDELDVKLNQNSATAVLAFNTQKANLAYR